jgi:hypothetical protein
VETIATKVVSGHGDHGRFEPKQHDRGYGIVIWRNGAGNLRGVVQNYDQPEQDGQPEDCDHGGGKIVEELPLMRVIGNIGIIYTENYKILT